MMRQVISLLSAICLASICHAADVYPSRPVRIIVPFGAGSTVDVTARLIAQQLSEQLGQSFVVENHAGASGTIGDLLVARAPPDGYTLMAMDTSTAIVPGLYKALPFDVARDFTPIVEIVRAPMALVVNPSLNVHSLQEFVGLVQANPGRYNYSSAGPGTPIHLATELFQLNTKTRLTHIPYKGGSDMVAAVLGGQVQVLLTTITNVIPIVGSGQVVALAVTTDGGRSSVMPSVPSMMEAGVGGMAVYTWFGLVGPAGLSKNIVDKLNGVVVKALAVPAVKERFVAQGGETVGSSPGEFAVHIRNELTRWSEVIRAAGIKAE